MKFGPVLTTEAAGKILGHNITGPDGRRAFRKGRPLNEQDLLTLLQLGRKTIYVAELEPGDVDENKAAAQIGSAAMGAGLRLTGPSTGRINLVCEQAGILRLDVARLANLNRCAGVTLATLRAHTPLKAGRIAGTLKVLPYALPASTVQTAAEIAAMPAPLLMIDPLPNRRVGLILSGSEAARERVVRSFGAALGQRLEALGSAIVITAFVPLEDDGGEALLAEELRRHMQAGMELIILAGETAIMDRYDLAPRAVEDAGGSIICYGAPVDPGNLLMLAYWGQVPILGAPGCARSPKHNIVDLALPRLLVGDRLTTEDIVAWGHGGLLEDVPERPAPRSRLR